MKAMVNIELHELDLLRKKIEEQSNRIKELEAQKDATITIDGDIYSWDDKGRNRKSGVRMMVYGNLERLSPNVVWREVQTTAQEIMEKVLEDSKPVKLYRKIPRWVKKLYKCD